MASRIFLLLACLILVSFGSNSTKKDVKEVREFIGSNWVNTIRFHPSDSATLIGLPKPYTVPSISGKFQEMYYWDTYFTNVGLIIDGRIQQAINNVENMCYLVNRYGYMPNGNRIWFLGNTQPPYLSMMIKDIYTNTGDKEWLREVLPALLKEYNFWMTRRITPIELNRYSNQATDDSKLSSYYSRAERLGSNYKPDSALCSAEKLKAGSHCYAECESGWDFSPRFENHCEDFIPIDLNSNLYMYEKNFAFFNSELNAKDALNWDSIAQKRSELINKYCYNANDGLFYDYNYTNNSQSKIISAGIYSALWSRLATKAQAEKIRESLKIIEFKYGIAACVPGERQYTYQWDFPNGWANLQYIAIAGLENYGYHSDARRIAKKYVEATVGNFNTTGNLWEKYNVTDGTIKVINEYEMPTMMGWTAGVFVYSVDFLRK